MVPILVCLLALGTGILWFLYSLICRVRALFSAIGETVEYAIALFITYQVLRLGWSAIIIIFTNFPVLGQVIKEVFDSLGGFGVILALPIFAIIGGIAYYVGSFALMAVMFVIELIRSALDFVMKTAEVAYTAALLKLVNVVTNCGGTA